MSAVDASNAALFTDLYELTMLQAYLTEGMHEAAVFELTVRHLPRQRNFLLVCGLADVLDYLEALRFGAESLAYLRSTGRFREDFLEWLAGFRFEGDVRALPEGTVAFAGEPLIEVTAPLPQAQLVETFVLNQVTFQTLIASKGVRVVEAAAGRAVVDFGSRRAHGTDAALKAARALYIAGFEGTSNVLAGKLSGIPTAGTMAHSYVQAHGDELAAFRKFTEANRNTVLLIDTYDSIEGVRRAIRLARELGDRFDVRALRLDSGDLLAVAREARALLDEAGLQRVELFASSGLDEYAVDALVRAGAPLTGFGVGTRVVVSADAPSLDSVYKLVEYAGSGRMKLSQGKATLPGRKQVFRVLADGELREDTLGLEGESLPGEPLLGTVMRGGRRKARALEPLAAVRERARAELGRLPKRLRALDPLDLPFVPRVSAALLAEAERVRRALD